MSAPGRLFLGAGLGRMMRGELGSLGVDPGVAGSTDRGVVSLEEASR